MFNIKRFIQKAAAMDSLVDDVINLLPNNEEEAEDLQRNYGELYSMILELGEIVDDHISSFER